MRPRLIVFDLDGTLIDTMGDYADQAARLVATHYGRDHEWARRRYLETSGLPFIGQLEELFPGDARNRMVAESFERWKEGYLAGRGALPPETARLLERLRARGWRLAISSNNLEHYVRSLAQGWPVDAALGYRAEDGFGKGEPHFRWLEDRFRVPREEMLFVGDSPNDARLAREAGVPFAALLHGGFEATAFLRHHPQARLLPELQALESLLVTDAA